MTNTPQPQAVDYSGRPLHEGAPVAYLSHDPIGLTAGRIRVISPQSICIETGPHLVTFNGIPASLGSARPRPIDGTVTRDKQEPFLYPQVALQCPDSGGSSGGPFGLYVGNTEIGAAVQAGIERHMRHLRTQGGGA